MINFINVMPISGKDQIKPWINQSIKNSIQKRENNYKLFKQRLISERKYKYFCNLVSSQIRIKKKYYEKIFHENKRIRTNQKLNSQILSNIFYLEFI